MAVVAMGRGGGDGARWLVVVMGLGCCGGNGARWLWW